MQGLQAHPDRAPGTQAEVGETPAGASPEPSSRTAARSPNERLIAAGARTLGPAAGFAEDLHALIQRTPLFASLDLDETRRLADYMTAYEVEPGVTIIQEGELGDYMLLLMKGMVEVLRRNRFDYPARIAVVQAGQALGEMSTFDGEPRFASCVTLEACRFAVLDRSALMRVLQDDPSLGNKVLLKLAQLLSDRLRQTSSKLIAFLESARDL